MLNDECRMGELHAPLAFHSSFIILHSPPVRQEGVEPSHSPLSAECSAAELPAQVIASTTFTTTVRLVGLEPIPARRDKTGAATELSYRRNGTIRASAAQLPR